MHDLLIKNGTVFDGSGADGKNVDILIKDGVIAEIGQNLSPARKTIDAKNHIITPGFIDLHTHYDGQVSWDDALQPLAFPRAAVISINRATAIGPPHLKPGKTSLKGLRAPSRRRVMVCCKP